MPKLRLVLVALATVGAVSACTPEQVEKWVEWHDQDPEAAVAFANTPEIQDLLINDWDHDGVVEPDNPAPSNNESDDDDDGGSSGGGGGGSVWDALAECESGGNWSINTGNGYYGGLQFLASTWRSYGGSGMPHQNSRSEQIRIAEKVRADVGWGAWPACTRRLGLR